MQKIFSKINWTAFSVKLKNWFKNIWNLSLLIFAILVSFTLGYYYEKLDSKVFNSKPDSFSKVKTRSTVSVSVNDRRELVFMDRSENKIYIYNDTIGLLIYDMYASKISKP